jgi:hypothetical protein
MFTSVPTLPSFYHKRVLEDSILEENVTMEKAFSLK